MIKKLLALASIFFTLSTAHSQISYTVKYLITKEKCHYCNKTTTMKLPLKIYNLKGDEAANILAIEVAKLFELSLALRVFENEDCTSSLNKLDKHDIRQDEFSSNNAIKEFSYTKNEVDEFVNKGSIQTFGELYPNTLKDCYTIVINAYKNK